MNKVLCAVRGHVYGETKTIKSDDEVQVITLNMSVCKVCDCIYQIDRSHSEMTPEYKQALEKFNNKKYRYK